MKARTIFISMLFILWSCTLLFSADYPIDKGSVMIDGSAMVTSTGHEDNDERLTEIMLNAGVHFFVIPNLAIGANLSLEHASYSGESATLLGLGPRIAYVFGKPEDKTFPFIGAGFRFSSYSNSHEYTAWFVDLGGGIVHMLNDYVGITARLFYQFGSYDEDDDTESVNTFGILFGIAAFLY